MQIYSATETAAALQYRPLIEGLREIFARGVTAPLRHHHIMPADDGRDNVLLLMPAWAGNGSYGGVKIVNVTPGNASRGLPAVAASYLLFDEKTGEHLAILDGATLTARRTAAASALAADYLARKDASTLLIAGAGRVGQELFDAYAAVRNIERVLIWNQTERRGEALAAALRDRGIEARFEPHIAAAVGQADIISCATLSTEPLIKGEWLKPGQHLDMIGSFTPQMREADDAAILRSRVFIDTDAAKKETGDIRVPLANGTIAEADICGTLYDLCAGNVSGRNSDDEITVFKGVGSAVEDLATAIVAVNANARG